MIFARLFSFLFLAVLIPGVALSQQQFANNSANHAKISAQTQTAVVQVSDITNTRVIEMTKLGLDDEIIMAKIKNGKCQFDLGDADLMELKKAGVSSKVVAAMLDASALSSPSVTVNKKEVTLHTMGEAKVGGRLGHIATVGIKSTKVKAYLEGPHSAVVTGSSPNIEIDLPKGVPIDNFLLVRLDSKNDRREIEVDAVGGIVGVKHGIRAEAIQHTRATSLGGDRFKMETEVLPKGDYVIYVVGSPDFQRGIYGRGYDFTVE
jgi:hypothetical protein